MKNKSILLNILLSAIIVVLVYQLNSNNTGEKIETESKKEEHVAHRHQHGKKRGAGKHKHHHHKKGVSKESAQKKSVGIKGLIMPQPALVIGSYSTTGEPDIMTAAWIGIANSNPLSIAVSIRPSRKTYDNIMATGHFTVNVPSAKHVAQMDYVGNISGHDENKFKSLGLTPVKGEHVNAPYVNEFPIVIECEVTDTINLGSHVQFIGKVLDTKVDVHLLDEKNQVDIAQLDPIIYERNFYYGYGRKLGKPFDIYKTLVEDKEPRYIPEPFDNATLSTIFNRKSVRHFTNQQVSKEQLTQLVKAGMAAPTAVDKRPWAFIAIKKRQTLDYLANMLPYAKMLKQATGAIVVCGDLNKALGGDAQPYWIQDCSAASQNILLAAESMGLGAVWTGVHPIKEREQEVQNFLNLPSTIIPLCVIPIGYPTGEDQPKNKWDESVLHWNKW